MTIGAIVFDTIIFIIIIGGAIYVAGENDSLADGLIASFVGIVILLFVLGIQFWYFNSTESGKRALKTQDSDFKGGISREVIVYDVNGKEIQSFSGKFDIEYDDDRILFDDEKGNRHIIYYPTGTVIINEKEK